MHIRLDRRRQTVLRAGTVGFGIPACQLMAIQVECAAVKAADCSFLAQCDLCGFCGVVVRIHTAIEIQDHGIGLLRRNRFNAQILCYILCRNGERTGFRIVGERQHIFLICSFRIRVCHINVLAEQLIRTVANGDDCSEVLAEGGRGLVNGNPGNSVCYKSNAIFIGLPLGSQGDGNILVGHSIRNGTIPSGEGIALTVSRSRRSGQRSAVGHSLGGGYTVDDPGQSVLVGLPDQV